MKKRTLTTIAFWALLAGCGLYGSSALMIQPFMVPQMDAEVNTEQYRRLEENGFLAVADHPLSTFSIDVDTASYSNVRRFLLQGSKPPGDAVRIEELINYFRYDYPQPDDGLPFAVTTEVASAPWAPEHKLVRIGLKGREMALGKIPPRNLVFLIDVSGSMGRPDRLPLVKAALRLLVQQLREQDHVAIVVYAGASGAPLMPTRGDKHDEILRALDSLESGGGTNGSAGIQLAYDLASKYFDPTGINRVILASDGDYNLGITDEDALIRLIEDKRKTGVFLTVLGFGRGNLKDSMMEQLADKGNGNYAYIDTIGEARKVLVHESGSTLVTIAKDTKIQIEMNPLHVRSYRLLGYENRLMRDADFDDDQKDAGELGAGHTVTAIYEIIPTKSAGSGELMTVNLRYKEPTEELSKKILRTAGNSDRSFDQASDDFRFAAAVAGFGMLLRDSQHAGSLTIDDVARIAKGALGRDPHGYRAEMLELVALAKQHGVSGATASRE